MITRRIARWIDDRFGAARFAQTVLGKVFPDHWSFMLGEVALYSFVMLVLTGTYLTLFFKPTAAEVVYKNVNVWADLAGLVVGTAEELGSPEASEVIHEVTERVRTAFRYAERPNRFVYGSDWPLVSMLPYRDFIRRALPEAHHAHIFEDNARKAYPRLSARLARA